MPKNASCRVLRLAFFSSLLEPMLPLHRHSSGAASLLHANAAAAPGARLCNVGACSHFAGTLPGLRLLCLACALAIAGSTSAGAEQRQPTFRSGTRLMVQTVTVKDKEGRPIEGLTSKDFIVSEDGEPQVAHQLLRAA